MFLRNLSVLWHKIKLSNVELQDCSRMEHMLRIKHVFLKNAGQKPPGHYVMDLGIIGNQIPSQN